MKTLIRSILALLLCGTAHASPPFPVPQLLQRAATAFIGKLQPGVPITLLPARVFRGALATKPVHFRLAKDSDAFSGQDYFVFSQGDLRGAPTREIRVGQAMEGQAAYRGWIALPLEHVTPQSSDDLAAMVKSFPYRPRR